MSDNSSDEDNQQENPGLLDGLQVGEEKTEIDKLIQYSLDPNNIQHFTELNTGEITAFSTLSVLAEKYKIEILAKWILQNLKLRVSKQRKGKLEFLKMGSRNPIAPDQRQNNGWNMFRQH